MKIQDLIANPDYPQKIILQKLICHYLNISREDIRINSDNEISNSNLEKIITWYNAYINDSKPLDYIIWYVEFFWNKFIVNQDTIVPRPETEYMITAVTEYLKNTNPSYLPLSGEQKSPPDKEGQGRFKYLPYDKTLTTRAKELRANMTIAEKKLRYDFLKDNEYKFTRQKPIDRYIVDFFSSKLWLVIEVDWDTHRSNEEIEYDKKRTSTLKKFWLKVIRFTNDEVLWNFEEVCNIIKNTNPSYLPTAKDGTCLSREQAKPFWEVVVDSEVWKKSLFNSSLSEEQTTPLDPPYQGDLVLIDVWTWSWVLWISVLLQNPSSFKTVFLTDYSQEALIVAKQNYDNLINTTQYDTRFIRSDLLSFVDSYTSIIQGKNIVLLGNLPYIPEQTHDESNPDSVKKREPRMAFVGGEDGLIYYYKMFDQILQMQDARNNNQDKDDLSWVLNLWSLVMFLEMMTRQVDILRQKYSDFFVFEEVKTFHFNIRIVKVWLK